MYGRKPIFLVAILILLAGSMLAGPSQTMAAAPHRLPRHADPARDVGRHAVPVGLQHDHWPRHPGSGPAHGLRLVGAPGSRAVLPLQLFPSPIFGVANAMGFTIGMAMFGAIILIPLFLQIVYGVSDVSSRLLGVDTPPWVASAYMVVVGVGLGLVMQVLVLAVQNDARPGEIGVATASATFFRSMGGAFGVALFGTIFATRLSHQLAGLPHRVTAALGSGVQLNPTEIDQLPSKIHDQVLHAFANALHGVFLFGTVLALVPFVLSWFLREKPLRTTIASAAEESPPEPSGQLA